ncbi:MAG: YccF domain-containing protein [Coriobacteriales bacterium]|nr:YccF domain-containing protein [Coriobacteriales bacterium]
MNLLGNIFWIILGGFFAAISWFLEGLLWCITIVGIPWGKQCFKFAKLSLAPFGKDIQFGGGAPSLIANIIWLVIGGVPMAIEHACLGAIFCITIVGIPWGLQHFKLAKLALLPFGATIDGQRVSS